MPPRMIVQLVVLCLFGRSAGHGQFSPGELSRGHQKLEGLDNCSQCHEIGNEISGQKCLTCHVEIKSAIDARRGYHFAVSTKRCVTCHKDHLGRDVQTTVFDRRTFDHQTTSFALTGKHASIRCEECHTAAFIRNPDVVKVLSSTPHATFLGLSSTCISCHEDRHRESLGGECQLCHTSEKWSPASSFDHAKTKYALTGKHVSVQCNKCHHEIGTTAKDQPLFFTIKSFTDCSPCHNSPHAERFANQSCTSCHTTEAWRLPKEKTFDHNLTKFKLLGRHATVRCEQCHVRSEKTSFAAAFKIQHTACKDCHKDFHRGEFLKKYDNDCEKCHTENAFRPATFTVEMHSQTRFDLTGAHTATPCLKCHTPASDGWTSFHFAAFRCESCHKDVHDGQFATRMAELSCAACHTTDIWKPQRFDHSTSRFPLSGRHINVLCERCHQSTSVSGKMVVQYRGVSMSCQSCHPDVHANQFARENATDCSRCHTAALWQTPSFDHDSQSSFR